MSTKEANQEATCGRGLAASSTLPLMLSELTRAVAEVLATHMTALDLHDENARVEHDAYQRLVGQHRQAAAALGATGEAMAGYRDLPMGRHDLAVMTSPKAVDVLTKLVETEEALARLLRERAEEGRAMLRQMRGEA